LHLSKELRNGVLHLSGLREREDVVPHEANDPLTKDRRYLVCLDVRGAGAARVKEKVELTDLAMQNLSGPAWELVERNQLLMQLQPFIPSRTLTPSCERLAG
jgi:hypothetical protein